MSLNCPRCEEVMLDEIEIGDVLVDRCPRCAGIWFDHDEIGLIVGNKPELKRLDSYIPPSKKGLDIVACPRCPQVSLRKITLTRTDGNEQFVYRCASCGGTWLDRGELRRIEDEKLLSVLAVYFSSVVFNE